MSDNLSNLQNKTFEALNTLFVYLQQKEEERNNQNDDKLQLLVEQNQKIISQNNELIDLCQTLIEKIVTMPEPCQAPASPVQSRSCEQSVPQTQDEKTCEQGEIFVEENKTSVQKPELTEELSKDTVEANDVLVEANKVTFDDDKATLYAEQTTLDENKATLDESNVQHVENKEEEEPVQEEKKTSSVLEFLHKKVIKDSPSGDVATDNKQSLSINSLTEQINQRPKSIAEQFENKTKSDLLTAIGVSEKFMFINDLFSGNIRDYTSFINTLNEASTKDKSLEIVSQMQSQKKWAKGSLAYMTLESIIEKRFE